MIGKTAKDPYITCSGKVDDAGQIVPGQKDDMSLVFTLNAYMSQVIPRDRSQFPPRLFDE